MRRQMRSRLRRSQSTLRKTASPCGCGSAAAVIQASYDTEAILTIEEHSIHGGLGEMVAGILAQNHCVPLKIMGFPDEEYKVGSSQELFEHYGLTAENIAREAGALLERARL